MSKIHYAQDMVNKTCKGSYRETAPSIKDVTCKRCLKRMFKVQPDGVTFDMIQARLDELK